MKRKWLAVFLLGILALSCFWVSKFWQKKPSEIISDPHFFVAAPLVEFTSFGIPCLSVEIENKPFIVELDLGFSGYANLKGKWLKDINNKDFVSKISMCGWKGTNYLEDLYEIPKLKIGELAFYSLFLNEEHPNFDADTIIFRKEGHELADRTQGRVGWRLFRKSNLFLDLPNSKVLFPDSIETLKKHGYPLDEFAQTSFSLDRDVIEVEAMAPTGPLRCFLDTGSTASVLIEESQPSMDPQNTFKIDSFQIGGRELGPINFHRLPFTFPVKFDAILGVDFFRDHQVFIDFANRQIYFAPSNAACR